MLDAATAASDIAPTTTSSSPPARRTAISATTTGPRHAPGLKTLADAFDIRARVIGAFERAERCDRRRRARALADLRRHRRRPDRRRDGRHADRDRAPHAARRVPAHRSAPRARGPDRRLRPHPRRLRAERCRSRRAEQLERLGVDVRTGCKVTGDRRRRRRLRGAGGDAAAASARAHDRDLGRRRRRARRSARARAGDRRRARPRRPRRRRARPQPRRPSRDRGHRRPRGGAEPRAGRADAGARRQPGAPSRWAARPRRTSCAACAASRRGRSATSTTATSRPSAARPRSSTSPCRCSARCASRGLPAWLFWLFAHIYFLIGFRNRLIGDGRLGLGLLHVRAQRARRRRAGRRRAATIRRLLESRRPTPRASHEPERPHGHPHLALSACASSASATRCAPRPAHAVLVPSSDPHLSEYLPERWQGRQWTLGLHRLDGHARRHARRGGAVRRQPLLGAGRDASSRGSGIALVKIPHRPRPTARRLARRRTCRRGATVGVDGSVLGLAAAHALRERARRRAASACAPTSTCSPTSGPSARRCRTAPVYEHVAPEAPLSRAAKLAQVRAAMARGRRDASLRLDRRRHRLAAEPARRRRQLQPGLPRPPAARRTARDAVRRRRQGRRRARARARAPTACASRRTPMPPRALAALPAGCGAAGRPEARHARAARARAGVRARRGDQPEHAAQEPQERRRGGARARGDGARTAPRCASSTPGSRPRSPTAASEPITELTIDEQLSAARARRARLRRPELQHDRRLQRQRRDAALPRDARRRTRRSRATACC